MSLALTARIRIDPAAVRKDRWRHEIAHQLLRSILYAEHRTGIAALAPHLR